jgi:hypothetical protein
MLTVIRKEITMATYYIGADVHRKDILLLLAFGSKILTDPMLISEITVSGD